MKEIILKELGIKILENGEVYSLSSGKLKPPILKENGEYSIEDRKKIKWDLRYLILSNFIEKPCEKTVSISIRDINKNTLDPLNLEWVKVEDVPFSNIPNYENYFITKNGEIFSKNNHKKPNGLKWSRIKTQIKNSRETVYLRNTSGGANFFVSRLVLLAYIGPCPTEMECCHNDGNSLNNNLENLRWDTKKSNTLDKYKHGTILYGEQIKHKAKLTLKNVLEIIRLKSEGVDYKTLSNLFGVSFSSIQNIFLGKAWKMALKKAQIKLPEIKPRAIITEQEVIELFKNNKLGMPRHEIAKKFKISIQSVNSILSFHTWKKVQIPRKFLTDTQINLLAAKGI